MAYATGDHLIQRYDERVVAKLLSDTGTAVVDPEDDATLAALLDDASGTIDAACMVGERYTSSELSGLTGNSLALLRRLTCDIAMWYLLQRRAMPIDKYPQVEDSLDLLDLLRKGERVFDVEANKDAGHAQVRLTSASTIQQQNTIRDYSRLFPARRYVSGQ